MMCVLPSVHTVSHANPAAPVHREKLNLAKPRVSFQSKLMTTHGKTPFNIDGRFDEVEVGDVGGGALCFSLRACCWPSAVFYLLTQTHTTQSHNSNNSWSQLTSNRTMWVWQPSLHISPLRWIDGQLRAVVHFSPLCPRKIISWTH
jgi:hypothetical protein